MSFPLVGIGASAEAARDAVRGRDEFLALLSHELRNPLSAILNSARLITRLRDDPQALRQAAESIDRHGWHMARLLDDLLDVSRVTSGKIHLRTEIFDLCDVAVDSAEAMREVFDIHGQEFVVSMPDEPAYIEGDRARLYQIVENLLSNAAKYTPEGGRIELALGLEPGSEPEDQHLASRNGDAPLSAGALVLRVRDNGTGIEADLLPAVFDMFTQAERTLARSSGGMGVGLTLVRKLVELHGGSISASSDGPRRGSEFVVRLPLTDKRPMQSEVLETNSKPAPRRVLIVEDNPDARRTLALLLKLEGHDVSQAGDGEEGLAALIDSPPDVALVDIGLPRIDGFELARRARANPNLSDVMLVAVTGYGQESDRRAMFDAGFDEHLVKPISTDQLANVLAACGRSQ